jgi:hypothetical protein
MTGLRRFCYSVLRLSLRINSSSVSFTGSCHAFFSNKRELRFLRLSERTYLAKRLSVVNRKKPMDCQEPMGFRATSLRRLSGRMR